LLLSNREEKAEISTWERINLLKVWGKEEANRKSRTRGKTKRGKREINRNGGFSGGGKGAKKGGNLKEGKRGLGLKGRILSEGKEKVPSGKKKGGGVKVRTGNFVLMKKKKEGRWLEGGKKKKQS